MTESASQRSLRQAWRVAAQDNNYMSAVVGAWNGRPLNLLSGNGERLKESAFKVGETDILCRCINNQLHVSYCKDGNWISVGLPNSEQDGWLVYYLNELDLFVTVCESSEGWQIYGNKEFPYFGEAIES